MNDYALGNYFMLLREKAGLTQAQLALKLGVSPQAVSKWENGRAMPGSRTMRKISALFAVSIDELFNMRGDERKVEITKIVLTGGPGAGKTTAQSWIQNDLTKLGYRVLFVPETATELITVGVAPWSCASNLEYQKCQMALQLKKEELFMQAARGMDCDRVVIVCDRGAMDNKAYMSDMEFTQLLNEMGLSEVGLRDNYDAVIHMVTAAKGAEKYYTTENNKARTESIPEAAALDDQIISVWTGHPHLRVIDNSTGFEEKLKRVIAEIHSILGEPEPYEIERKFLIKYPESSFFSAFPAAHKVDIIQTYLNSRDGEEIRIRQRGENGSYVYYKTRKIPVGGAKRIELEQRLSQDEYLRLLMEADSSRHPIRKTRWCLIYEDQYFELDIYPFWKDRAVLEIELNDEAQEIKFPPQLEIIREVTGDENYKNSSLALSGGIF